MHGTAPSTWSVPRSWTGESAFVVCGGESVLGLDLSRLSGRRVVVINSSWERVPDADYLVFSDRRWWLRHGAAVRRNFRGRAVTITPMRPSADYLLLERQRSGGLSPDPRRLALWHTTVTAAVNLVVHLGVREIDFLGLDGRGGWHHAPHEWKQNVRKFHYHGLALRDLVEPLRALGIAAYNANPDSAHDTFPHKPYEEMLA